jgi:glycosyltransferase involved in cell wall biosynthesis
MARPDQTAAEIERLAQKESRIRLFQQENRGKARALQRGLAAAHSGSWFSLMPTRNVNATRCPRLLEPFADERIGAVSGHAKVGKLRTFHRALSGAGIHLRLSIWIGALTTDGKCITLCPARLAPFGRMRLTKRAGSVWKRSPKTPISRSRYTDAAAHRVCALSDRVDRSARDGGDARATTFAVGVRHPAMSLETSRHGVQLELSRTRLVQFTQHLVLSDHSDRLLRHA